METCYPTNQPGRSIGSRLVCLALFASFSILSVSCSDSPDAEDPAGVDAAGPIVATNYPLYYFASRILGERGEVEFPVPPDIDPAFWEPTSEDVRRLQSARLILMNGAEYEKWAPMVSIPDSRVVDTSDSFSNRLIDVDDAVVHRHGPDGDAHAHGKAFTTWLDPELAVLQATSVADALIKQWPEHEKEFRDRLAEIIHDLQELDEQMTQAGEVLGDQPLLASHPVYQYAAAAANLNLESLHWEPDVEPSDEQWLELEEIVADHAASYMIWEGEPLKSTSDRLASLGISCVVFEPCGNRPSSDQTDYVVVMKENIARLKSVGPADPSND